MNSNYFDIYRDKKYILPYNLGFKKCQVNSDSSKLDFKSKAIYFNFAMIKNISKILQ